MELLSPVPPELPETTVCIDFTSGGFSHDDVNFIKARLEEDFGPYGYRFIVWSNGCDLRLVFGGNNSEYPTYYGLSQLEEGVSHVYTGRMLVDWLPTRPHDLFLQGVANTAAHELGHQIAGNGQHSDDWNNVMSVPPLDVLYYVNQVYTP
jgi:hypothetical protein